jgi:hypothetical protein
MNEYVRPAENTEEEVREAIPVKRQRLLDSPSGGTMREGIWTMFMDS